MADVANAHDNWVMYGIITKFIGVKLATTWIACSFTVFGVIQILSSESIYCGDWIVCSANLRFVSLPLPLSFSRLLSLSPEIHNYAIHEWLRACHKFVSHLLILCLSLVLFARLMLNTQKIQNKNENQKKETEKCCRKTVTNRMKNGKIRNELDGARTDRTASDEVGVDIHPFTKWRMNEKRIIAKWKPENGM